MINPTNVPAYNQNYSSGMPPPYSQEIKKENSPKNNDGVVARW